MNPFYQNCNNYQNNQQFNNNNYYMNQQNQNINRKSKLSK